MKSITIEGNVRSNVGKKETNTLRKQGNVPCSIYGGKENVNFYSAVNAFKELVYTPEFYTATIKVDGNDYNCVMQDIQFHPISDEILHIDFRELHPDKKIILEIPVSLEGVAPGTKEGGRVNQRMKKVKVRLLPKDLVEHITVNIGHLTLGKAVRISEMKVDGIEFLNAPHIPIVNVMVPRVVKEETSVAAAATTETAAPVEGAASGAAPAAEKGAEKKDEKKK
ncbi:MAG: 50S ribosomal protein L25/general stress protein Ctc [Chitinophagales bacterium]|nr:50S ribosomal protein L25/general stress protein Ctc [Chitinophagales bacterium]